MSAVILLPEYGPKQVWITLLGGATSDIFVDIAVDSSGNSYVAGNYDAGGTSGTDGLVAKFDNTGSLIWQTGIRSNSDPGASSGDKVIGISLQGSDVFVSGQRQFAAGFTAKLNTSGVIQWQRELSGTNGSQHFTNISDGTYMYSAGGYAFAGGSFPILAQVIQQNPATGAFNWIRRLGHSTPNLSSQNRYNGSVVDGGSNIYLVGVERQTFSGAPVGLMAKFNSSGANMANNSFGDATDRFDFTDCALDGSGNLYAVGTVTEAVGAGPVRLVLVQMNPVTLAVNWQRYIGDGTTEARGTGIWISNTDQIFVSGWSPTGIIGSNDIIVAEYNTSGTLQWHNVLGGTFSDTGQKIGGDNNGNIYMSSTSSSAGAGGSDGLVASLPDNGGALGTYGAYTYQAGALANGISTYTNGSSSIVLNSPTGAGVANPMNQYTTTLTETNEA